MHICIYVRIGMLRIYLKRHFIIDKMKKIVDEECIILLVLKFHSIWLMFSFILQTWSDYTFYFLRKY